MITSKLSASSMIAACLFVVFGGMSVSSVALDECSLDDPNTIPAGKVCVCSGNSDCVLKKSKDK
jgi:hypothetical protein